MRLTRFSDIGLRVLMYLAKAPTTRPVTVAEVSQQFDVPYNHMVKVVGTLAKKGWVHALRGRNGGMRMAADPATLRLGSVLRVLEGEEEVVDCEGIGCHLSANCRLRHVLREGVEAFYRTMDATTLAEVIHGNTGVQIVRMHQRFLAHHHTTQD